MPVANPCFYTHANLNTNTLFHLCNRLYINPCIHTSHILFPLSYPKYIHEYLFIPLLYHLYICYITTFITHILLNIKSVVYYHYLESHMSRCLPSCFRLLNLCALVVYNIRYDVLKPLAYCLFR